MVIKENVIVPHYDCACDYRIVIETDSSIEKDIILKHLQQAQEEYSAWIRKFTKGESNNG